MGRRSINKAPLIVAAGCLVLACLGVLVAPLFQKSEFKVGVRAPALPPGWKRLRGLK